MKNIAFLLLLPLCLLFSCKHNIIYTHYEAMPADGWNADSAVVFPFEVDDAVSPCDIVVNIRHTETYPYQNIWLFTDLYADTMLLVSDTLEYYLADRRGNWLGSGFGRLRDMPCLQSSAVVFPMAGNYKLCVRQAMRTDMLQGVEFVGCTVSFHQE